MRNVVRAITPAEIGAAATFYTRKSTAPAAQ